MSGWHIWVINLAQQRFYWPGMATDVTNFVQKKCRCIVNKRPNVIETAPLETIETTHPLELISIDYMQLDKCKGNFQYAMVVTDNFTKFCQIYATKNKTTKAAADKLFNNFIMEFGFPERIHSDQGGEFTSKLFQELQHLAQIRASTTTPYHPQGNGQTERMNRSVCNMLKTLSEADKRDWKAHLPKLAFAYNSTVNKTTGFSPMYLMFGPESRLPIDLMFQKVIIDDGIRRKSHQQFVKEWHESMKEAMEVAQVNMQKSSGYNQRYHDRKAKIVEVQVGDQVLVRNYRDKEGTGKLRSFWEEAIFVVLEQKKDLPVYKVQNIKKPKDVRVIHRNKIMKCEELPVDIFDKQKVIPAKKVKFQPKKKVIQNVEPIDETPVDQESDEEDPVVIVEEFPVPQPQELDGPGNDLDTTVAYEDMAALEVVEEESEEVVNEEVETDEENEESEASDPDSPVVLRRGTRNRYPAQRSTYPSIGGDLVLETVGSDGGT